jgi:PAS domain S-box-containing protein
VQYPGTSHRFATDTSRPPTDRTVLIVNGRGEFLDSVATELADIERIAVEVVHDPDAALTSLQDSGADAVVSAYELVESDGLSLLRDIRGTDESIPFVLCTDAGSETVAASAIRLGATDYVRNEVDGSPAEIATRIESAIPDSREPDGAPKVASTEPQLSTILDHVPLITYQVDTDGTILLSKGNGLAHFGREPDELVGESVFDIFADHEEVIDAYNRAIDGEYVQNTLRVDGSVLDEWYRPVYNTDGNVKFVVGISVDVTQRERQREQLEQEIDRLDEFADVLSHDLRNPLSVAIGRLEIVEQEFESEHFETIGDSLEQMESLIEDMLTLARGGEVTENVQPVNIGDLARSCWATVPAPNAELVIEETVALQADPSRLHQVLGNLFRNAIDHSSGHVSVRVGTLADGFYVADDGPGFPAELHGELCGSENRPGIGLRIVSMIADAHEWEVTLRESDDSGARVDVRDVELVDSLPTS